MIKLLLGILIFLILTYLLWYYVLRFGWGKSPVDTRRTITTTIQKGWKYLDTTTRIKQLRQTVYCLPQDFNMFEDRVNKTHIFRYFKFSNSQRFNQDIVIFYFSCWGLNGEYADNRDEVANLIYKIFADLYIEWTCISYISLYVALSKDQLAVWFPLNGYGALQLNSKRAQVNNRALLCRKEMDNSDDDT